MQALRSYLHQVFYATKPWFPLLGFPGASLQKKSPNMMPWDILKVKWIIAHRCFGFLARLACHGHGFQNPLNQKNNTKHCLVIPFTKTQGTAMFSNLLLSKSTEHTRSKILLRAKAYHKGPVPLNKHHPRMLCHGPPRARCSGCTGFRNCLQKYPCCVTLIARFAP